jgi:haloalkane dehalogenase
LYKKVHIIFGADDPYLNTGVAMSFHEMIPGSTIKSLDLAGHYVQVDQPEQVAECVLALL